VTGPNLEEICYAEEDGVATVTLDRPARLNALGLNMAGEFLEVAKRLAASREVRAVILTGAGRAFCTGRDLKESAEHTEADAHRFHRTGMEALSLWERLPMATIAAVNGHCFGWGMEVTLCCDIRLAAEEATLGFPECALGILPGQGGAVRLPRLIPAGLAKELIYTARRFDGREAERTGLMNRVHPGGRLIAEARALAGTIRDNGPLGVQGAKTIINTTADMPLGQALAFSDAIRAPLTFSEDFREALDAFREKRKPIFRGK
jgi:enoyl-CoA hydratase/carnithine racemase